MTRTRSTHECHSLAGQALLEYALVAAVVVCGSVAGLNSLRGQLVASVGHVADTLALHLQSR